jgi:hypothetical protein
VDTPLIHSLKKPLIVAIVDVNSQTFFRGLASHPASNRTCLQEIEGKMARPGTFVIASIVDHLGKHPELLRLDTLSAGVLEKNDPVGSGPI